MANAYVVLDGDFSAIVSTLSDARHLVKERAERGLSREPHTIARIVERVEANATFTLRRLSEKEEESYW